MEQAPVNKQNQGNKMIQHINIIVAPKSDFVQLWAIEKIPMKLKEYIQAFSRFCNCKKRAKPNTLRNNYNKNKQTNKRQEGSDIVDISI